MFYSGIQKLLNFCEPGLFKKINNITAPGKSYKDVFFKYKYLLKLGIRM